MSSQSYSYSTTSYSSSSYSSSTGGNTTHAYAEETYTDPSGTQRRTMTKEPGQPVVEERTNHPAGGRPVVEGSAREAQNRIEDVTDQESEADKRYRENMEDEYAKREGGA